MEKRLHTALHENNGEHLLEDVLDNPPILFRSFSDKQMQELLRLGDVISLRPFKELPVGQKELEVSGYLVLEGLIELRRGGCMIEQFEKGEFIGEAFLHARSLHSCELRATLPTRLMGFRRSNMMEYFRARPGHLLRLFTINVIEVQHRHIYMLYRRINELQTNHEKDALL